MRIISKISIAVLLATGSGLAVAQTTEPAASVDPAAAAAAEKAAKAAAAAEAKAAKAAAAEAARKQRELVRLYGLGPYPEETDAFLSSKPESLRPLYRTLYTGGERNAVLNFQRLGLAAIDQGEWKDAEWAFDRALGRIEAIYANNPQANAARSAFHNEANKDYKGEPYERSMAYYYRGLLYLRAGDYDNARASFKGAEFQDTLSEAETFQSDFAVMEYLIGWTQWCQGQESSASESFAIASKGQAGLNAPKAGDNTLFLAELGNGPLKARSGSSEEMLTFVPGPSYEETAALFTVKGTKAPISVVTVPASSVNYQATTRGGRAIDGIMKGKASLKETTSGIGDAAMRFGMNQGGNSGMASMGLGLAMSMFSSAMKTKADIRAWDGLPDTIGVGTAKVDAAKWTYDVQWLRGQEPLSMSGGGTMRGDVKGCSVVWARSRRASLPDTIVGEDEGVAKAVRAKKPVQEKDRQFRQWLES